MGELFDRIDSAYDEAARQSGCDLAVIDCPAVHRDIAHDAAALSDFILIPTKADIFDVRSMTKTIEVVRTVGTPHAVVLNFCPPSGPEVPAATVAMLLGNAPDPFNPTTRIRYRLEAPARVSLDIYDISGRLVRKLVRGATVTAGRHEVNWDGRSDAREPVGSGVYFARLRAGEDVQIDRMVLIR